MDRSPSERLTTKIHALIDAEGRPIRLALTPGRTLLTDRTCDSNVIRDLVAERGT